MPAPPPLRQLTANTHIRRLAGMVVVTTACAWLGVLAFNTLLPERDKPFAPRDLLDRPGLATAHKLNRLAERPEACFVALNEAEVGYTRIDRPHDQPACRLVNALTLDRSLTPYSATLSMSCPMTAALHIWERHVVLPAAEKHFGTGVARIESYGSFACRRVNNARDGRWSQHASANAVDISGFRLDDGRRVTVLADYGKATPEGRFLADIRDGGCTVFTTTLGPEYNALHADHFHFDMGSWRMCR